jgi:hypothetical protein
LPLSGGQRIGIVAQLVAKLIGCLSGKACMTMQEAPGYEAFRALWPISIHSVMKSLEAWIYWLMLSESPIGFISQVCKKKPAAYRR